IGTVESLWRYPVKSMAGEELDAVFAGFAGVYGDRLFAFQSSATRKGLPYLTAREQNQMVLYRPRFRHPEKTIAPANLTEAEKLGSGTTPVYGEPEDLTLDVTTPTGRTVPIDHPELPGMLCAGIDQGHHLALRRSERAQTDCRPLSLFAVQTASKLAEETGLPVDKRRFRANLYLDLTTSEGFAEDAFVGRSLRIGPKVTVSVLQRDGRCVIMTLDPDTAEKAPALLKALAQNHEGMAGVYAAVLVEGMIRKGDTVELLG
ncbi:MAG: MOSC domain-containing protein, partial [Chthoniobacterales bacterium]